MGVLLSSQMKEQAEVSKKAERYNLTLIHVKQPWNQGNSLGILEIPQSLWCSFIHSLNDLSAHCVQSAILGNFQSF